MFSSHYYGLFLDPMFSHLKKSATNITCAKDNCCDNSIKEPQKCSTDQEWEKEITGTREEGRISHEVGNCLQSLCSLLANQSGGSAFKTQRVSSIL